jgi:uncharacterized protein YfiM (DUF2279 family)
MYDKLKKFSYFFIFLIINHTILLSQTDIKGTNCKNCSIALLSSTYAGISIFTYYSWYDQYSTGKFHLFDDSREWLGMDKIGHFFSAYTLTNLNNDILINCVQSNVASNIITFTYLASIEVMDGFSEGWGFSINDLLLDVAGIMAATFLSEDLQFKFSFHQTKWANLRPELLGNNFGQQILKDYNGQTYWASLSLNKININLPDFLMLSFGYGAEAMIYGNLSEQDLVIPELVPYRQFYLSIDINLWKIIDKNIIGKWKYIFYPIKYIKTPMPTLEFSQKKLHFHSLYF